MALPHRTDVPPPNAVRSAAAARRHATRPGEVGRPPVGLPP